MKRMILIIMIIIGVFNTYSQEINPVYSERPIDIALYEIVEMNWNVITLLEAKTFKDEYYFQIDKKINDLQERIIENQNNQEFMVKFMDSYKSLDGVSKKFIYENLILNLVDKNVELPLTRGEPLYAPGYGELDTDHYFYKLGRELKTEFVNTFWMEEKRKFEDGNSYRVYVTAKVAAELTGGGSAAVKEADVLGSKQMMVNGKMETMVEVNVVMNSVVETKAKVLYEKRKVWFELWRAPQGFFPWLIAGMDFKYVKVGQCYLVKEFPSPTDIIIDFEEILNL